MKNFRKRLGVRTTLLTLPICAMGSSPLESALVERTLDVPYGAHIQDIDLAAPITPNFLSRSASLLWQGRVRTRKHDEPLAIFSGPRGSLWRGSNLLSRPRCGILRRELLFLVEEAPEKSFSALERTREVSSLLGRRMKKKQGE